MATKHTAYGTTYTNCHIGPIKVMRIGKSDIWAGRHADMKSQLGWDLRIRFSDQDWQKLDQIVHADHQALKLLPSYVTSPPLPPTLDIEWPDFQSPDLNPEWWGFLVKAIEAMPEGNIGINCFGGHGRTGTALSIMAALSGNSGTMDPVEWVRRKYCEEAVESYNQLDYIKEVLGDDFPVSSLPAAVYHNVKAYNKQGTATTQVAGIAGNAMPVGSDPTSYGEYDVNDINSTNGWHKEDGMWVYDPDYVGDSVPPLPTEHTSAFNDANLKKMLAHPAHDKKGKRK